MAGIFAAVCAACALHERNGAHLAVRTDRGGGQRSAISRDTEGKQACIYLKTEAPWKCPPSDVFPRWRKSG
eukprot:997282-Prymnesium_polylepis.1